ncbi:MAG: pyridoxamine 5'-phosphate oxidase family protein [Pseudomonadota bacterium]
MIDPIRPTDAPARAEAQEIAKTARIAALGVLDAGGAPAVSRIAIAWIDGPVTLVSTLSEHTGAILADPRVSLLLGEAGPRGDPLNQARLTLFARAEAAPADARPALRSAWLAKHPKAKLYIDFTDFGFFRFHVTGASLNGGFGKAYRLTPADLGL